MAALAGLFPARSDWRTPTVRQSALALSWTVGLVVLSTLWYYIEKYGLRLPLDHRAARFLPTISIGIPHILIGFFFAMTSRRMKGGRAYGKMAALLALGAAGCWLFYAMGGARAANQLPVVAVSFYFIVHLLRDQRFFYYTLGDAPAEDASGADLRFLEALQTMILIFVAGLALIGMDVYVGLRRPDAVAPMDYIFGPSLSLGARVWLVAGTSVLLAGVRFWLWGRSSSRSLVTMLGRNQPLVAVLILFCALILSTGGVGMLFQAFVLWHVVEWFIFATRSITAAERPTTERLSPWRWMRGTRRGFLVLHLGGAFVVLSTILIWTYGFGKTGPLAWVVGADSFYYWTIMHVTVSFEH